MRRRAVAQKGESKMRTQFFSQHSKDTLSAPNSFTSMGSGFHRSGVEPYWRGRRKLFVRRK